jgi:methyl-accepting chemotaxis protein
VRPRFGLRTKLFGGFGVMLVLLVLVGMIGWTNARGSSGEFSGLYDHELLPLVRLDDVQRGLYEIRVAAFSFAQADEPARRKYQANEAGWFRQIEENMQAFASAGLTPVERRLYERWEETYARIVENYARVAALEKEGDLAAANNTRVVTGGRLLAEASSIVDQLVESKRTRGEQKAQAFRDSSSGSEVILIGAVGVALVFGLVMALSMARSIAGAVAAVGEAARRIAREDLPSFVRVARAMAEGDLTQHARVTAERVRVGSTDEIGAMAADFNEMIDGLRETDAAFAAMGASLRALVGDVRATAGILAGASGRLGGGAAQTESVVEQVTLAIQGMASGAQETSSAAQSSNVAVEQLAHAIRGIALRANEQAERIRNVTGTTTRMASGVRRVAADAGGVAGASEQARATAERGAEAVRQTVAGMVEIREVVSQAAVRVEELGRLGERIGAVVETIDDIADQTNLLALNAAIEAARAGEHGRGFAVVADEVRKLAERSRHETRAIAGLIDQVQAGTQEAVAAMDTGSEKVAAGTAQAERAGAALAEIVAAVERTAAQASGIAAAAREMAEGAHELRESMEGMGAAVEANLIATDEMVAQAASVTAATQAIAAVSEEQSASSEEVSASAEEMSAHMTEIGRQAQELAATAEQLRRLVVRFTLDGADDRVVRLPRAA